MARIQDDIVHFFQEQGIDIRSVDSVFNVCLTKKPELMRRFHDAVPRMVTELIESEIAVDESWSAESKERRAHADLRRQVGEVTAEIEKLTAILRGLARHPWKSPSPDTERKTA